MPKTETPSRPVLRWHGGKWLLAPWIISHFPKHKIYTEVYGGAASVLLRKPRADCEIYNDLDGMVVNLFKVLRDPAKAKKLRRTLELTPFARDEFAGSYLDTKDPLEKARRLIIRCFLGFGSNVHSKFTRTGFRARSTRSGLGPAWDWVNYPSKLEAITTRLAGVVIENKSALELLKKCDAPNALHYVDPPYVHSTRKLELRHGRKAYDHEMTDLQHRQLAGLLKKLKGYVILSGYRCPLYDSLYFGWMRVDRAALADGAKKRTESLWINQAAWEARPQQTMDFGISTDL